MKKKLRTAASFFCAVLVAVAALPFLTAADKDGKEVELRFDGRPKVGEAYQLYVNSKQVRTYRMKLVGISNPPRRRETHEIQATGELVYQSLDPLVLQFKVESLSQIIDGEKTDYAPLSGMTAIIRSSGVNLRDIPVGADENAAASVLGGPGGNIEASGTKTTKELRAMIPGARRLIASMFAAPIDRPEEYLGASRKVKPGGKWTASAKPMLDAIKANGLELSADKISAKATYNNASKVAGISAQNVYFLAESDNIPGYDFKLEVFFTFPDGGGDAPLRVERSATEVVNRAVPEGVPGFSGSVMDCVTTDQTDFALVRKSAMKTKKGNWFLDLF